VTLLQCPSCLVRVPILHRCTFTHAEGRCLAGVCFGCYGPDRLCPPHRALRTERSDVPENQSPTGLAVSGESETSISQETP
jgi:hypothetical protein